VNIGPPIYVEFYFSFVKNAIACSRIGGGALTDVLEAINRPGICVLSSLFVPLECPIMKMGRATVDLDANTITQNELPELDRKGASFWLFWHGSRFISTAAHYLSDRLRPEDETSVKWIELNRAAPRELADEQAAREHMELAWTTPLPHGPVIVRFQGVSGDLQPWLKASQD
jgi:hypothetical protein